MKRLRNTGPVFKRALLILLSSVFILQSFICGSFSIDSSAINGYTMEDSGLLSGYVYHIKACRNPRIPKQTQTKYLDVINGLTADNSEVWVYELNLNAACQEWRLEYVETDSTDHLAVYRIKDINSGKYLSIQNDSNANWAKIVIRSKDNSTGQLFKIKQSSLGGVYFLSKCSNYRKAIYKDYRYTAGGIEYYRLMQYTYLSLDYDCLWEFQYASHNRYVMGLGYPDSSYIMHYVDGDDDTGNMVVYNDNSSTTAYIMDFTTLNDSADPLIKYEGNGYYSIKSNGKYLTAANSTKSGKPVSWSSNSNSEQLSSRQLWKMEIDWTNKYCKLRSKNLVEAGKYYYLQKNGITNKLVQGTNSDKMKWHLLSNEPDTAYANIMVGVIDSDSAHQNHSNWMESAANSLYKLGQNSSMMYYQIDYTSPIETYKDITEEIESGATQIVTFRGHGGGNQSGSQMYLYDLTANSTSNAKITNTDVRSCNFSSTEIILYIGCKTAKDYSNINSCANLPKDSVDYAGCKISVGFTANIGCSSANKMAKYFYKYYSDYFAQISGYNTMTASQQQTERINCYIDAIKDAAKIAGLASVCVYYYNGQFYTC